MATSQSTVDYLADQLSGAGKITSRKMFGEYALYCNGKVVALICDDRLFVKPTDAGRVFIGSVVEAPPYPGAKMYFLIEESFWDDRQWLCELIAKTEEALPAPKRKK
jgi:DNA transformation protein